VKFLQYILLLTTLTGSFQVVAQWYQVEVIVFEHLRPNLAQEVWFENPGLPSRAGSIELLTEQVDDVEFYHVNNPEPVVDPEIEIDPVQGLIPFLSLGQSKFRLKNDYRILRLSAEYRPLTHLAWQQPAFDRSEGRAVHLEGMVEQVREEELPPELAEIQIVEDSYHEPEMIFDGNILLRATQYLHLDLDMAFFPQNFQQILINQQQGSPNANNLVINRESDYVRLTESRRIRLNELHYFDHPLFGVLVQVSRLEMTD
jgi:hypothetical protein